MTCEIYTDHKSLKYIFQKRLKTAFSRQKSYTDPKRKEVSFSAGDLVFLKVSPIKAKLAPRYIGPFGIQSRVGEVTHRLVLPPKLSRIHPVFHVLMLRKCITDPSHVLQPQTVELSEDLTYEEYPVAIVDRQARQLRTKDILMVKVL